MWSKEYESKWLILGLQFQRFRFYDHRYMGCGSRKTGIVLEPLLKVCTWGHMRQYKTTGNAIGIWNLNLPTHDTLLTPMPHILSLSIIFTQLWTKHETLALIGTILIQATLCLLFSLWSDSLLFFNQLVNSISKHSFT